MRKIKALYTLSGSGKIFVSKDKEYDLHEIGNEFFIFDNYGEKLTLTKEEIAYRFE